MILHNTIIGRHAVVKNAIIDKNVDRPRGRRRSAWTRSTTGSAASRCPRAGITVVGKSQKVRVTAGTEPARWPCSPGSTRRTCTAAPACTSLTWPGNWPAWSTLTVHCEGGDRPGAMAHQPWDQLAGANQALAHHVRRPGHDRRGRRGRPGALAHLVRQPRRAPGVAAVRRAARDDHALAGAAAALEGRAARRRLRAVQLVRAGRGGVRRRDHRGVQRDAVRRAGRLPGRHPGAGALSSATGSTAPSTPRIPARPCWTRYGVDPARPAVIFVGRITRQKGVPVLLRAAASLAPQAQLVLLRRPAGHARAGRRGDRAGDQPAGRPGPG